MNIWVKLLISIGAVIVGFGLLALLITLSTMWDLWYKDWLKKYRNKKGFNTAQHIARREVWSNIMVWVILIFFFSVLTGIVYDAIFGLGG